MSQPSSLLKSRPVVRDLWRLDVLAFIAFWTFALILVLLAARAVPDAFELGLNPFALISLGGLITNLVLLALLFRGSSRTESTLWFGMFITFDLLWSLFELMQRLAVTPAGNAFWSHIIFGITGYLPAFFYLFVRSYTDRTQTTGSPLTPVVVLGTSTFMSALIAGDGIFPLATSHQIWGYPAPTTAVSLLFAIWLLTTTTLGTARLVLYYYHSAKQRDRQQTGLLLFGTLMLGLLGAGTTFVLPAFHIFILPPLGVFASIILASSVIYGMYRYGSFSVNVRIVAENVLGTMTEAVFVTDRAYRVLYANQAAERLFAGPAKTLTGNQLATIADGLFMPSRTDWEAQLKHHHSAEITDLDLQTAGHPLIANLHVTAIADAHEGYVFVLNDITKLRTYAEEVRQEAVRLQTTNKDLKRSQRATAALLADAQALQTELKREQAGTERVVQRRTAELRAERARLEAAVGRLNVGFIMTDPTGNAIMINGEARAIIAQGAGLQRSSQLQVDLKTLETVLSRAFDLPAKIKQCIKQGKGITEKNIAFNGSLINIFVAPIIEHVDGSKAHVLGVVILIEDNTQAVMLERSRDEFFSIASHELRTPLTAIRGNTQLIETYYANLLKDPQLKEMVADIHESSIRLIHIVNDFLDTSRLEQKRIEFHQTAFPAMDLLHQILKEYQAAGINPQIYLRLKEPDFHPQLIWADRDRLKQVIINLIGNALKFTTAGGVTISLRQAPEALIIAITDTGQGVPADSRRRLFNKFQQASNNNFTRDSSHSTGLGLYISRLIMTSMGGSIDLAETEVGKGSTFAVTVPLAPEPPAKKPIPKKKP
jgi:PAS domain S-box-containing protein